MKKSHKKGNYPRTTPRSTRAAWRSGHRWLSIRATPWMGSRWKRARSGRRDTEITL